MSHNESNESWGGEDTGKKGLDFAPRLVFREDYMSLVPW